MRRVAAALAIVALAAALALWPVLLDDSAEPTMPRPAAAPAPADRAQPPKPAEKKPKTRRFTVSVSGDLLMHSPLLARALANGGGESYDFAPFFEAIEPYVRVSTSPSVTSRPRSVRARRQPTRSSTRRSASPRRSSAAAGTLARRPPITRLIRESRGFETRSERSTIRASSTPAPSRRHGPSGDRRSCASMASSSATSPTPTPPTASSPRAPGRSTSMRPPIQRRVRGRSSRMRGGRSGRAPTR